MAAQFCMKCGTALPSGAGFCPACGAPVPSASGASAPMPTAHAPAAPTVAPTPGVSLGATLGLEGKKNFLVQHQILSLGHSYRVMDPQKNHLFTVRGDTGQNLSGNFLGNMVGGDGYLGRYVARSVNMTYTLVDAQGTVHGSILKEGGANQSTFTLTDSSGQRWVTVSLARGLMGGITATAVDPGGQPMMRTSGNLIRHNFMIQDASGRDLAKVHEAWVAVRDTYNIDLVGGIDPLYPLVFTILIDFEKVK